MWMRGSPWLKSLEGKHVLITGGSSGIGLAIAKEALSQGAFITLIARNYSKLEKAVENLAKKGTIADRICYKEADVGDYEALSKAVEESFEWRPIDVLVCNAGVNKTALLDEAKIGDLHAIINTNLVGVVNTLHAGLPLMKKRSGQAPMSVVLMNSLSALYMLYGNCVYTATKHALNGLGETLKMELLPYTIRISMIYPGFVETPLLDNCGAEEKKDVFEAMKLTSFYDRSQAEPSEKVAKYTLEAVKNGTFFVTSGMPGLILSTISRGSSPADSFGRAVIELLLYIPLRLLSFLGAWYFMTSLKHGKLKK